MPIWLKISHALEKDMSPQFYQGFFGDITPISWDGKNLTLGSHDKRVLNHIERNYCKTMESLLYTITGEQSQVNFKELSKQASVDDTAIESEPADEKPQRNTDINTIRINPRYTFNRFIKGPSNEHALAAAMGVAESPTTQHNPLYLYGGVGLGKTHLMMAIGNEIQNKFPWLKVLYIPAETFQHDLVEAVAKNSLLHLRARYRKVDILLFDDIQFISQRAEFTQEEIFHTFNYLYQNNKHIVISGDRPPQQLSTLSDRLVSRFQSGLIVDIKPPNFETRMAILSAKAQESNLLLPHDVMRFIAGHISDQIRVLEAALIKLGFVSNLEKRPIDIQMAKIVLRDLPAQNIGNQISIDEIIRVVSQNFHVNEDELKGSSRVEAVSLARHICMYITKKMVPSLSLSKVAAAFGRSDHTTVIHADKKISEMMDHDEAFAVQIREIMETLKY